TPENIETLKENEVFVFGSNLSGVHGAGAARLAIEKFGAITGVGYGLQGQSFAIPTKDFQIRTLRLPTIDMFIKLFLFETHFKYPNLKFVVTKIGCGLAGHSPENIAPFFKEA